jgi:hypothetical protein
VVGIDPVVFGTDYPYLRRDLAVSCRDHIEATPELTDGERTAVLGATGTTLIPRLASLRLRTGPPLHDATRTSSSPRLRSRC